jgi:hypothetical protein
LGNLVVAFRDGVQHVSLDRSHRRMPRINQARKNWVSAYGTSSSTFVWASLRT